MEHTGLDDTGLDDTGLGDIDLDAFISSITTNMSETNQTTFNGMSTEDLNTLIAMTTEGSNISFENISQDASDFNLNWEIADPNEGYQDDYRDDYQDELQNCDDYEDNDDEEEGVTNVVQQKAILRIPKIPKTKNSLPPNDRHLWDEATKNANTKLEILKAAGAIINNNNSGRILSQEEVNTRVNRVLVHSIPYVANLAPIELAFAYRLYKINYGRRHDPNKLNYKKYVRTLKVRLRKSSLAQMLGISEQTRSFGKFTIDREIDSIYGNPYQQVIIESRAVKDKPPRIRTVKDKPPRIRVVEDKPPRNEFIQPPVIRDNIRPLVVNQEILKKLSDKIDIIITSITDTVKYLNDHCDGPKGTLTAQEAFNRDRATRREKIRKNTKSLYKLCILTGRRFPDIPRFNEIKCNAYNPIFRRTGNVTQDIKQYRDLILSANDPNSELSERLKAGSCRVTTIDKWRGKLKQLLKKNPTAENNKIYEELFPQKVVQTNERVSKRTLDATGQVPEQTLDATGQVPKQAKQVYIFKTTGDKCTDYLQYQDLLASAKSPLESSYVKILFKHNIISQDVVKSWGKTYNELKRLVNSDNCPPPTKTGITLFHSTGYIGANIAQLEYLLGLREIAGTHVFHAFEMGIADPEEIKEWDKYLKFLQRKYLPESSNLNINVPLWELQEKLIQSDLQELNMKLLRLTAYANKNTQNAQYTGLVQEQPIPIVLPSISELRSRVPSQQNQNAQYTGLVPGQPIPSISELRSRVPSQQNQNAQYTGLVPGQPIPSIAELFSRGSPQQNQNAQYTGLVPGQPIPSIAELRSRVPAQQNQNAVDDILASADSDDDERMNVGGTKKHSFNHRIIHRKTKKKNKHIVYLNKRTKRRATRKPKRKITNKNKNKNKN